MRTPEETRANLERAGYFPDDSLAVAAHLALDLGRPLLVEGEALTAALATEAGYAGMIGSRRKMAERFPPQRLAALRAPAGLDIGGVGPEDIALSILAEIVRDRRKFGEDSDSDYNSPS